MKKTSFAKIAAVALCTVFAMAACSDDDDNNNVAALQCNPSSVTINEGATQKVIVSGGKNYTATTGDSATATVSVVKDTLFVKGVKAGSTNVVVTDSAKLTATVPVTVAAATAKKK